MKVCVCDRCGRQFSPRFENDDFYSRVIQVGEENFGLNDIVGEINESYDICDSCYEDFRRWFKRGALKRVEK